MPKKNKAKTSPEADEHTNKLCDGRPCKKWTLQRKKYFKLRRSRDDFGIGVTALLSAGPEG